MKFMLIVRFIIDFVSKDLIFIRMFRVGLTQEHDEVTRFAIRSLM